MFKKIALLCLLNAPLFCQDTSKNPVKPDPSSIKEELKSLQTAQKQTTQAIQSLRKRLPLFPRTKIFIAGALAGSATILYLRHQYPEAFQCPRTQISRIRETFESPQSHQVANNTTILSEDELDEEDAACASNSCYFK